MIAAAAGIALCLLALSVAAPDVIATAGHCVDSAQDCASIAFVFGYRMSDARTASTTFPASSRRGRSTVMVR